MPRLPGLETAAWLLAAPAEAVAALPDVVASFAGAVRGLGETVQQARETLAGVQRLTARLDGVVDELEEPLRALGPGLRRLAVVLDDPVVGELPDTLRQVRADVLPVLRTLADTSDRLAFLSGSTDRLMSLAGLPGAGLLGRRGRPAAGAAVPTPPPALD